MSNVLIGIIGVILFIGLALAGALFLGPRFQQATNVSKSAAVVSGIDQVAKAAKMRKVSTGSTGIAGSPSYLVSESYLKSLPSLPGVSRVIMIDRNGSTTGSAAFVVAEMGTSEGARGICDSIERNSGGTLSETIYWWTDYARRRQGCYRNGTASNWNYLAYSRILAN